MASRKSVISSDGHRTLQVVSGPGWASTRWRVCNMKPIYVPGCSLANGHQAWFQGKAAGHLLVFMVRKLIPDMTNWLLFVGETEIVSDFGHSEDDGLIFCGRQRFHRLHLEMSGKTELWKITLQNFCVPGCKQDQFDCPLKYTPRNGYLKC